MPMFRIICLVSQISYQKWWKKEWGNPHSLFLTAPPLFSCISRVWRWVSTLGFTLFSYVCITQIFSCVVYMVGQHVFPCYPILLTDAFDQANYCIKTILHFSPSLLLDPEMTKLSGTSSQGSKLLYWNNERQVLLKRTVNIFLFVLF